MHHSSTPGQGQGTPCPSFCPLSAYLPFLQCNTPEFRPRLSRILIQRFQPGALRLEAGGVEKPASHTLQRALLANPDRITTTFASTITPKGAIKTQRNRASESEFASL